jgi:glycosyltransferase involved in cell wall biosynthesis
MPEPPFPPLNITFLLPLPGTHPIGGFKVVYEYANFLAGRGHHVSVVHPAIFRIDQTFAKLPLRARFRTLREYLGHKRKGTYKPGAWFTLNPAVKLLWVPSLAARNIPNADIVIATAWETAEWAAEYPAAKGRKFYLIQHLETWSGPEDRVLATWKLPLEKIVIAQWLQKIAGDLGQRAHLIYNGLDFSRFQLQNPIESREVNRILAIHHSLAWKGAADALAAFKLAQAEHPGLRLTMFGMPPRFDDLPGEIVYHQNPSQETIASLYNQAAIFISASWTEGFSLPPAEALQCGAAIAMTDIEGPASYAFHEQTALLSPVKDPVALAANILRLVRDPELRIRLARAGHEHIRQFTWQRAGEALESLLFSANRPETRAGSRDLPENAS